ncbi:DUF2894 domain-containing protein [Burkholderia plantarii]|uniref:DUF2894 domain-containing protein n=1 Tax=Burkholderia plantarii TaxID=41899 RepID=UPI000706C8E6|nr:DUF2894 domain-containing protein [Burkholderia plantarii]ALK34025.1 hypothetical protein bpln_2g18070 [Burkholderia plantarii]GLZ22162.1 hypothetical protein Bpla01_56910 [Burkholderia plantarii]
MSDALPPGRAEAPAPDAAPRGSTAIEARLAAWRAHGADRLAPVRFAALDALARRASTHAGAARRVLDARLDARLADYAAIVERAATHEPVTAAPAEARPARHAFAALRDDVARAARRGPPAELLDYFREVWSKLSADQQVQQSLDRVPKNAGPLNSSSLVHRALLSMRELSPDYLRQFLAYADALSWLEDLHGDAASTQKEAPRATAGAPRKTRRAKAR